MTASVRYVLRLASLSLAAGPKLEAVAEPIAVQVDGIEMFRIPRLVAGFSVEGRAEVVK